MAVDLLTPFTKVQLREQTEETKGGIGIFWGAFDPVHTAHLLIADQVRQQLQLETVFFLPEAPKSHQLEMLNLVAKENPFFQVDARRKGQTNGIYESLLEIKNEFKEKDLYFIVGGDLVSGLNRWPHIEELLKLVQFVGVQRPRYRSGTSYPLIWVDTPLLDISSSQIRAQIKKGLKPNFLLSESVLTYIEERGLYV